MQHSKLSKVFGTSILALSLSTLPLTIPASAQTVINQTTTTTSTNSSPVQTGPKVNDGYYKWEWLGLFGLAGLAVLLHSMGRRQEKLSDPKFADSSDESSVE